MPIDATQRSVEDDDDDNNNNNKDIFNSCFQQPLTSRPIQYIGSRHSHTVAIHPFFACLSQSTSILTMIFSVGTSLLLSASVLGRAGLIAAQSDSAPSAAYRPPKIAYRDLVADEESFSGHALLGALGHVGMISVTGIPGMADMKRQVLTKVDACARRSRAVQTHTFGDGTVRRTLATHTVPGPGGVQEIHHHDDDANDGDTICNEFAKDSKVFRSTVAEVTNAFAARLSSLLDISPTPLLSTKGVSACSCCRFRQYWSDYMPSFHCICKITPQVDTHRFIFDPSSRSIFKGRIPFPLCGGSGGIWRALGALSRVPSRCCGTERNTCWQQR
jgi:hypothetical protein